MRKHGHRVGGRSTLTWNSWHCMIERCARSRPSDCGLYFDAGVRVCRRWKGPDGFAHFLADMGPRPGRGYSLGRKSSRGGYTPANCEWQCWSEQNSGGGFHDRTVTIGGEAGTLVEWADRCGITYKSLIQRLRRGWPVEVACSTPRYQRRKDCDQ